MNTDDELYDSSIQEGATDSEGNIGEVIYGYLKHWKWFLLSLIVFLIAGYFYVKSQVPQYRIQTQILIKDTQQSTDKIILDELGVTPPNIVIENEILIMRSNTLVEKVVKDLDLQTSYYSKGRLTKRILYKTEPASIDLLVPSSKTYTKDWPVQIVDGQGAMFDGKKVPFNKPTSTAAGVIVIKPTEINGKEPYFVTFSTVTSVAQQYINKMVIAPTSKQSNTLLITIEDAVPSRGENFLNRVVEEYTSEAISDKNKNIASTITFIDERLRVLQGELGVEEKNVEQFKSKNNITDLGTEASTIFTNVGDNDSKLTEIDLQLTMLKQVQGYLSTPDNLSVVQPSLLGLTDNTVTSMVNQLGELKLQKQSLLRTVPETNPIVASINDQIISLKASLREATKTLRSSLLLNRREVEKVNNRFQSQLKQVPVKERQLMDVMRNKTIKDNLFNFLLQKREETGLSLASNTADSRVINPARSSGAPIKPVISTLYLIFISIVLALPVAVIFIRDMLNNNIRRKSDISKNTRVPIISQISESEDGGALTIITKPRSLVAEEIRALRTNLDFLIPGNGCKVILFTSTVSGEGKSFISLNLGASLASTGKKVIILELDLRKPKLLSTIGLEKKIGLSDYLIGKVAYKDIIRAVPQQENFYMIESGTIPPNPAEILMNSHLPELITALKAEYDYVLVDAPPIGLVTDAQILGKYADVTFFLMRHNFSRKDHIHLLNELYTKKIFKNLNIIFNSIDTSSLAYGYRYDYSYYGESEPKSKSWLSSITNKFTKK